LKKRVVSIFQYLFFLILGLGLLWLAFRKIDLRLVFREMGTINYYWIALAFLSGILSHVSRAVRWNLLIASMNYPTSHLRTFYAVMVGYLANLAIPRIGEVTRCGVLSRTEKIPVNNLIGTVISERIFDMIVLLLMTLMVILLQLKLVGGFVNKYLFTPLSESLQARHVSLLLAGCVTLGLLVGFVFLIRYLKPWMKQFPVYQKVKGLVFGFLDGILTITRMKQKWAFLFWTVMIWGNYFLMTYLCFFAMPATRHLGVMDGLTVLTLGSFGFVAPVPGGIGAYHFIVKAILFELYGLTATSAASYATVTHFAQTVLLLAGGAVSYLMIMLYLKRNNNLRKTRV